MRSRHPSCLNFLYNRHNLHLLFLTHSHNFHKDHKQNQILLQKLSDYLRYHYYTIQSHKLHSRTLQRLNHKQNHHRQQFVQILHHRLRSIPNDYRTCNHPTHQILHRQLQHKLHLYYCNNLLDHQMLYKPYSRQRLNLLLTMHNHNLSNLGLLNL